MPIQARRVASACNASALRAHFCDACSGPMRLVMATASRRRDGARYYACEYLCDCGYREFFDEEV
jgi:hypothetical protein